MKNKIVIQTILFVFLISGAKAQTVVGFWGIVKVTVGNKIMTPVAKWTKINGDHSFQSGNGWLQNSAGTWNFNEENTQFIPEDTYGLKDEYGAFTVSFSEAKMKWERDEDGMKVVVSLEKIEVIPKSTTDRLTGLWDLKEARKDEKSITATFDPENKYYIFIRWDRLYTERTAQAERKTGYWHINAHRPEITLIPHAKDEDEQAWQVDITDWELRLHGVSDSNKGLVLVFDRIREFPE